jgi:hypothetical protein
MPPSRRRFPFFNRSPGGRVRAAARLRRIADAPDRDLIGELIIGSDLEGFEPQTVQTLWAASAAGTSSAVGEAALRQALWSASFEQHLAEIHSHLPPIRGPTSRHQRSTAVTDTKG